jgi:GNAT superfamily N-acetyltransferase
MAELSKVKILHNKTKQLVQPHIVRLTEGYANDLIDSIWWKNIPIESRNAEDDEHWNWASLIRRYCNGFFFRCVGLISPDELYVEGALLYQINAKSQLEADVGCFYIERLAAAPRNRHWLISDHVYTGVGSALLYWTVRQSYSRGLGGRILLESLPSSNTVNFYLKKGFIPTGKKNHRSKLEYYELPKDAAEAWMKGEGDFV